MTNVIVGNGIGKEQKRIIYIILVVIFLSAFFTFLYLIFILINSESQLVTFGDKTTEFIGLFFTSLGAILGIPLGKSWWQTVYKDRKKGLILRVK